MKKVLTFFISCLLLFIITVLIHRFLYISFKPNKISKELYGNLEKVFVHNGMIVDISECLNTEWDSIYILGHFSDSLKLSRVVPPQYGFKGKDIFSNCIVLLKSGKIKYIDYFHEDGFTNPPVKFFFDNYNDSYLITHKENNKFIIYNNSNHYFLFLAEKYTMQPDTFFWNSCYLAVDDRLFIEKFSAFWNGDINLKELFE